MRAWLKKWWSALKALFTLAVIAAVGWYFARDLRDPRVWAHSYRPASFLWFALAAVLYLLGFGLWATYWYWMLRRLGQHPGYWASLRAYFVGLMGKYLPGKAWALLMRATLVRGPGVRLGVAGYTALYEVLTTMSTGCVVALVLFAALLPDTPAEQSGHIFRHLIHRDSPDDLPPARQGVLVFAAVLFCCIGVWLLPGLFNRLVRRVAASLRSVSAGEEQPAALPHVRLTFLPVGFLLTGCGWLLWGASLWATLQGVLDTPGPWHWGRWGLQTAALALAYVAGFVIVLVPSGIGVREFFLTLFLVAQLREVLGPDGGEAGPVAVLTVVIVRLVWTAAEVVAAGVLYWLPGPPLERPAGDTVARSL